jgi:hypothetical protein
MKFLKHKAAHLQERPYWIIPFLAHLSETVPLNLARHYLWGKNKEIIYLLFNVKIFNQEYSLGGFVNLH